MCCQELPGHSTDAKPNRGPVQACHMPGTMLPPIQPPGREPCCFAAPPIGTPPESRRNPPLSSRVLTQSGRGDPVIAPGAPVVRGFSLAPPPFTLHSLLFTPNYSPFTIHYLLSTPHSAPPGPAPSSRMLRTSPLKRRPLWHRTYWRYVFSLLRAICSTNTRLSVS